MKWEYITQASLAIQIHLVAALVALALGVFMWMQPKGTARHKLIGRIFVILMLLTAISAIFIREINRGQFSWIHIFVPITLIGAWQTVYYIRRKNVTGHMRSVKGLFFGALLIPGFFAFMPGRTLWMFFFG